MTRVQADPDTLLVLHEVYDLLELPEVASDSVALTGHVLEDHLDTAAGGSRVGDVDSVYDVPDTFISADLATTGAWMNVKKKNAKLLTSLQLIHKDLNTLVSLRGLGGSEVEEVRAVGEDQVW